jgi:heparan-alpha-glucosaminide N-acetyltransferase
MATAMKNVADKRSVSESNEAAPRSTSVPAAAAPPRLVSLDAFRGFIMLAMASAGFHLAGISQKDAFRDDRLWQFLGYHTEHAAWRGCAFWDLIQPAFMFMVGVAMAYSYAARQARGQSYGRLFAHAAFRSVVLVLLGVFLTSNWSTQTEWVFTNVLCQIGLGYTFLFLLWNRPVRWQLAAAAIILVGDWALFYAWPAPSPGFDYAKVNLPANWQHLTGTAAHWDKNTNIAAAIDRVVLNWFPRKEPFTYSEGGYTTLSFVPSLATMIFGLLAGGLMRNAWPPGKKIGVLVAWGAASLAAGFLLDYVGICPSVKRIWTPSWTLFSTGWVLWMLAGFYVLIDVTGWRLPAWPLVVVGMNSIVMYVMSQLLKPWLTATLERHLGKGLFTLYGKLDPVYAPAVQMLAIVFVFWLVCVWLYRQKIFVRI